MASSSSSSASVHAAIQALYGSDSARRREANDFLVAHAATPAAWETALHLLASADASVCYFGANLLHGKCKADFASLPPAHRGAFLDACSNALDGLAARGPECFLAARRLCLVLAAGSARCGPERVDALVARANALAESGLDDRRLEADENASADEHASSSSARQRVALALELQAGVAEEVADLADPHARSSVVLSLVPRVVEVLSAAEATLDRVSAKKMNVANEASSNASASSPLMAPALRAALAWLRLDEHGAASATVLSAGQIASSRPGVLRGAVVALASEDRAAADAGAELLVAAVSPGAGSIAIGLTPHQGQQEMDDRSAVLAIVEGVLAHGPRALLPTDANGSSWEKDPSLRSRASDLARTLCVVATAVCERDADACASHSAHPSFLRLTELVLACVETHGREVMEAAADYLLMLNTVSTRERHPALREPLFERVLAAACSRHAALPDDEDEETWERFREHVLADVLETCYGALGARYFEILHSALAAPGVSWRTAEAAAFAARAPAREASRKVVVNNHSAGGDALEMNNSDALEERVRTERALAATFGAVVSANTANTGVVSAEQQQSPFAAHPRATSSACRLAGAYAAWFGGGSAEGGRALAKPVVGFLLAALRSGGPAAFPDAAVAFRATCARCAKAFAKDPGFVDALIRGVDEATPSEGVFVGGTGSSTTGNESSNAASNQHSGGEDRRACVVEGLARVVASVRDPANAVAFARRLVANAVARANALCAEAGAGSSSSSFAAAAGKAASEIRLVASAIRFLEFGAWANEYSHPAMAALESAWPTLAALDAEPWRGEATLAGACHETYAAATLCARRHATPVAPRVVESLTASFQARRHPSALDALATALEVFSTVGGVELRTADGTSPGGHPEAKGGDSRRTLPTLDPEARVFFAKSFDACVSASATAFARDGFDADVARAAFEHAKAHLVFAPAVSFASPAAVQALVRMATATLAERSSERDAASAAITFLSTLANPGERAMKNAEWRDGFGAGAPLREWFLRDESSGAAAAVHAAVRAGARATTPRHLLRPLAQLLVSLLDVAGGGPGGDFGGGPVVAGGGTVTPVAADAWLQGAIARCEGAAEGWPDDQTRRGFGEVLCGERGVRARAEAPRRWVAAACDFFLVCQRELAPDALLGHQMG